MRNEPRRKPETTSQSPGARSHDPACRSAGPTRKGDDIAERLLDIAAGVIKLLPALGEKPGARSVVKQLERCGPSAGPGYEEARGAESGADFVHKVRIALKELRETRYWLKLILRAQLVARPDTLAPLIDEASQLIAILTASASTAKGRSARCG
jgi:four helix bundle protein